MGSLGNVSGVGNSGLGSNATSGSSSTDDGSSGGGYDEIRTVDIYAPIAKLDTPDALKVTGTTDGPTADFTSFLLNQFLGQAYALDSATSVTISGQAGTVGANDDILFYDDSGVILQTTEADADGAFSATFDASYIDTAIHFATFTDEPAERSYSVTVTVYFANYWQTALLDEATLIGIEPVFSGRYLIYTTEIANADATTGYAISVQNMHGGAVENFIETGALIRELRAPQPGDPATSPLDTDTFLVGITPAPDLDVVRLDTDGTVEIISDALDPDESYIGRHIALQPQGNFVLSEAPTSDLQPAPLVLLSTFPDADQATHDIILPSTERVLKPFTHSVTWATNSTVISLTGYTKTIRGVVTRLYRAELYDLSNVVVLSNTALLAARNAAPASNPLRIKPVTLFDSSTPIFDPVASHLPGKTTIGDTDFFAFACMVGNVTQICMNDYNDKPVVLTTNRTEKAMGSVSLYSDFIAYTEEKSSNDIQVIVFHVPTGSIIPITGNKSNKGNKSVNIEPQFTTDLDNPYTLFYMCAGDDSAKLSPCVFDLANHKLAGAYIHGSPYYRAPE